jgi:2-keto-4-pentenoate hydratase/2-oxohepta-3-ene-1,7-dioic acid hydratase in catechol pathway
MRVVSYAHEQGLRGGIAFEAGVVDLERAAAAAGYAQEGAWIRTRTLAEASERVRAEVFLAASRHAESGATVATPEALRLGPPVPDPEKVICLGLNYRAHADEADMDVPAAPVLFPKFRSSLIGDGEQIRPPAATTQLDYEGELAVVMGAVASSVQVEDALRHVWGVMPANDITARDLQIQTSQWLAGKAADTFCPCGPELRTIDEIPDLQDLQLSTYVNGELAQQSSTARMIFSVAETISFISNIVTLVPGDVVLTGTPAGVGHALSPPRYLQAGDEVTVEVEMVGRLTNTVGAPRPMAAPLAARSKQGEVV